MDRKQVAAHRALPLRTPSGLDPNAVEDVAGALNALLADVFALYLKTKNFHWHMSGPHFRDNHVMLDEQAAELFAMTDALAERVRKIGGMTLRSVAHIGRLQRLSDDDAEFVTAEDMIAELRDDNHRLAAMLRTAHETTSSHDDHASTSVIENWIDEAERRHWFLFEASRRS
jgi:starvation-inducible DNA-binding protein